LRNLCLDPLLARLRRGSAGGPPGRVRHRVRSSRVPRCAATRPTRAKPVRQGRNSRRAARGWRGTPPRRRDRGGTGEATHEQRPVRTALTLPHGDSNANARGLPGRRAFRVTASPVWEAPAGGGPAADGPARAV
jgi:hypothetical protein